MIATVAGRMSVMGILPLPTKYLDRADTQHMLTFREPLATTRLMVGDKPVLSVKMLKNGKLVEVPLQANSVDVWKLS